MRTGSRLRAVIALAPRLPARRAGSVPAASAASSIRISDADATTETRSLFAYLRDQRREGILFGHQQTTEFGVTFDERTEPDGIKSDVRAGVGDHPAVFGWDMGHEGYGSTPGTPTPEENFAATVVAYEAYPSMAGTAAQVVTILFADWRPAPWDTGDAGRRITPDDLTQLSQFNIFFNETGVAPRVSSPLTTSARRGLSLAISKRRKCLSCMRTWAREVASIPVWKALRRCGAAQARAARPAVSLPAVDQ